MSTIKKVLRESGLFMFGYVLGYHLGWGDRDRRGRGR